MPVIPPFENGKTLYADQLDQLTVNDSAAITGGTIDGATVGATAASTVRGTTLESTVITGTAPLIVASTTEVANLHAATATALSATLPVNKGGTGETTYSDGQLLIGKTDGSLAAATLTQGSNITITNGDGAITIAGTASGSVTSASVVSANGFAGSVATATTTPAITMSVTFSGIAKGNGTALGAAVAGTDYLVPPSGTAMLKANSGGALANATAGTDYSAGTASLSTGILKSTTSTGELSIAVAGDFPTLNQNTSGSAATLTTPRAIYGNNFDGSAVLAQVIASTYGGTGNGFAKLSGPTTSEKTFTLPDASASILTSNAAVTVAQGGTGLATLTANNVILGNGSSSPTFVAPGTSGNVLTSNGTTWQSSAASSTPSGLVCLAAYTLTNQTSQAITSLIDSTYDEYVLSIQNITSNDSAFLYLNTSSDNGSNWDVGTSYSYQVSSQTNASAPSLDYSVASASVLLSTVLLTPAPGGTCVQVNIIRPSDTSNYKCIRYESNYIENANTLLRTNIGVAYRTTTSAINAVLIGTGVGNATLISGYIKLYGVRKSV